MKKIKDLFFKGVLSPSFINTYYRIKKLKKSKKYIRGVLLDVGCGNKFNKDFFEGLYDFYIGLDYADIFQKVDVFGRGDIKIIRKKIDVSADAHLLPFKKNSVDTIVMTEVLEHLQEPLNSLKQICFVLKKDGYLILTVPFMLGEHQMPFDYFRYTREMLKKILVDSNFSVITIEPYSNNFSTIMLMINSFIFFDILLLLKNISKVLFFIFYLLFLPVFVLNNLLSLFVHIVPLDTSNTIGFYIVGKKNED